MYGFSVQSKSLVGTPKCCMKNRYSQSVAMERVRYGTLLCLNLAIICSSKKMRSAGLFCDGCRYSDGVSVYSLRPHPRYQLDAPGSAMAFAISAVNSPCVWTVAILGACPLVWAFVDFDISERPNPPPLFEYTRADGCSQWTTRRLNDPTRLAPPPAQPLCNLGLVALVAGCVVAAAL